MRLTMKPIEIDKDDPYKNDLLNRKEFGDNLVVLLDKVEGPLVLAIDAPWGEGKSTFVKMWQQDLIRHKDYKTIYIDSFETDYMDDAFLTVVSEVARVSEELNGKSQFVTRFIHSAADVGGKLFAWSAKLSIKAATLGLLNSSDLEELKEIGKDIATGMSNTVSKMINDQINSYISHKEVMAKFHESLTDLSNNVSGNGKKLIIIIDELDRCKPTYAISMLERIKHFFMVDNVAFILVVNKEQLKESIRSIYGLEVEAGTYLQKFITVDCQLPKRDDQFQNDYRTYIYHLNEIYNLNASGREGLVFDSLKSISSFYNLSLRDLEKIFTNIVLFYSFNRHDEFAVSPTLIVFMGVCKVKLPNLYTQLKRRSIESNDAIRALNWELNNFGERGYLEDMIAWLRICTITEEQYDALPEENDLKKQQNIVNRMYFDFRKAYIPTIARLMDLGSV